MAQRVPITVRIESFEGPLDLLLYLIQSHEMDISKISLTKITHQYLAYVRLMQELNFDIASEFLVMAATLIQWKSKALLPVEKIDGEDVSGDDLLTQDDLIRQLMEHRRFLLAGQSLGQLPQLGHDVFTRPNSRPPIEKIWKTMNLTNLTVQYQNQIAHARKRKQVLRKETVSLSEKMREFGERLQIGQLTDMTSLLPAIAARPDVVVNFLAALELSRLKKAKLYQEEAFKEIYIELLECLKNFDFGLATGFSTPIASVEASVSVKEAVL